MGRVCVQGEEEGGMSEYMMPTSRELPPGWKWQQAGIFDSMYYNQKKKLRVLLSIDDNMNTHGDWIHVSYSHPSKTPTHETTNYIRRHFIGEDRECISVFPPKERYVNIHLYCLHLWSPLDSLDITWPHFEKSVEGLGLSI